MSKIEAIAQRLAEQAQIGKNPYQTLEWIRRYSVSTVQCTEDELNQAYFAAVNILKAKGVEAPKRKPLSDLSKPARQKFRKIAKAIAQQMTEILGRPVTVPRSPIKDLSIGIEISYSHYATAYYWLKYEHAIEWNDLDEPYKTIAVHRMCDRYKSPDDRIKDNLETIKANLEALI